MVLLKKDRGMGGGGGGGTGWGWWLPFPIARDMPNENTETVGHKLNCHSGRGGGGGGGGGGRRGNLIKYVLHV